MSLAWKYFNVSQESYGTVVVIFSRRCTVVTALVKPNPTLETPLSSRTCSDTRLTPVLFFYSNVSKILGYCKIKSNVKKIDSFQRCLKVTARPLQQRDTRLQKS